jgi:hypothetical protein
MVLAPKLVALATVFGAGWMASWVLAPKLVVPATVFGADSAVQGGGGSVEAMSARVKLLGPLVIWTLFVWTSRIRNVWADEDLTTGGQILRTGYSVVFLTGGLFAAWVLWSRRGSALRSSDRVGLAVFFAWSVVFWLIRGIGIIVDDHDAGFTAIHTVLMVISLGLVWLAVPVVRERSADRETLSV